MYTEKLEEGKQMKVTVEEMRRMYPKARRNGAITGHIPMDVFLAVEKELREDMREYGLPLRVFYRGPRVRRQATNTLRADATHAVIYVRA